MTEFSDTVVEVCCGSASDVMVAANAGADRVELNACITMGGLTPSYGAIEYACACAIPVAVMIRPRSEGFIYSNVEIELMRRDIINAKKHGAAAVVFGCLAYDHNGNAVIDETACKTLLEAADGIETVFHRAFDMLSDSWEHSLERLIALGFTRVLTSGQQSTALLGICRIRELVQAAKARITILPCGKIRADNAKTILCETGCVELHTSAFVEKRDLSSALNPNIRFCDGLDCNTAADGDIVRHFVASVKGV